MNELMTNKQTMSSREIAELVESRHDKVKQSIERLKNKGLVTFTPMGETSKMPNGGEKSTVAYHVNKRDSYVIVAQLSPEFTARLVDRWQELEEKEQQQLIQEQPQPKPTLESDKYIEAAKVMKATRLALGVCCSKLDFENGRTHKLSQLLNINNEWYNLIIIL